MLFLLISLFSCCIVAGLVVDNVDMHDREGLTQQYNHAYIAPRPDPDTHRKFKNQESLLQFENSGIDGPQFGIPRTGTQIIVQGQKITLGQYLWSGRTGEYYDVPGGWPGWDGDVVAKEFYIWYWPHELTREVKNLRRVGQLVAQDEYEGFRWLIMYKPPGVHLTKTRAFKEAFQKGRQECDALVESIYEPAFNAIIDLLRGYGIYHQAMNARMLWDEMAHNATIFDLGDDESRTPEDAEHSDVRNQVALAVYMAWPNDGVTYQDWCVNGQAQ
ncbi:hypothetical protein K439DRAFT_1658332 [Ramaria rubella]|nr:hypothetical protein K439DRAFT_1658332 [Ramaria rubella]